MLFFMNLSFLCNPRNDLSLMQQILVFEDITSLEDALEHLSDLKPGLHLLVLPKTIRNSTRLCCIYAICGR